MGIGVSLFLIAVGAILAFAVSAAVDGINLEVVGWILMGVGALGVILSLVYWSTWGGFGGRRVTTTSTAVPETTVVERTAPRSTVVERDVV
jgi:hypothetical protein